MEVDLVDDDVDVDVVVVVVGVDVVVVVDDDVVGVPAVVAGVIDVRDENGYQCKL